MRTLMIPLLLTVAMGPGSAVQAAPPWQGESPAGRNKAGAGPGVSMSSAVAQVQKSTGGRVIGARQSIDRSGRPVYLIKVLMPNGVVRVMQVPAR